MRSRRIVTVISRQSMDVIYVMGVSGCGKSTVGRAIAETIGWDLFDGDSFHSDANKEKMRKGTPLTDEDRRPWLEAIQNQAVKNKKLVIPCSALKKAYRDTLRRDLRALFVFLKVERGILEKRVAKRENHFFPVSLLDSQFSTLEDPTPEPDVFVVENNSEHELHATVERIKQLLK